MLELQEIVRDFFLTEHLIFVNILIINLEKNCILTNPLNEGTVQPLLFNFVIFVEHYCRYLLFDVHFNFSNHSLFRTE